MEPCWNRAGTVLEPINLHHTSILQPSLNRPTTDAQSLSVRCRSYKLLNRKIVTQRNTENTKSFTEVCYKRHKENLDNNDINYNNFPVWLWLLHVGN